MGQKRSDTLGQTITRQRQAQGLSLRQLAELVGCQPSMVLRWERDDVVPKSSYLTALARALELPTAELFSLSGTEYPYDAPTLPAMLRAEYNDLPPEAVAEVERAVKRIARKYGAAPARTTDE